MDNGHIVDTMTPEEQAEFRKHYLGDLPSVGDDTGPDPLDPVAFHGLAGDIVRQIEPHTEADPVAILVQFLVAFGSAAGRNAYFSVGADQHHANLYAVLVGDSSKARKGTSQSYIRLLFESADEIWAKGCQQSGLSSGEGIIWAVHDLIEKQEPIRERGGKISEYQTVIVDAGVSDKRLLVVEAEFASTLRVMQRDGNTLSAVIRNGWDTGDLRILTKTSPARATGAHVSIVGHITADELRRYLDKTEAGNGFANRFLWLSVKRSKCLPEGGRVPEENLAPILFGIRRALDYARQCGRIAFDTHAREIWHRVYPQLSEGHPGLLGAVTARQEAQAVRLALIYALLDCSPEVRESHMLAALAIVEFVRASAASIFGDATGDPIADDIMRALRRTPGGMTRTEISNLFGRNKDSAGLGRALAMLAKAGKVTASAIATDGRPREVWFAP